MTVTYLFDVHLWGWRLLGYEINYFKILLEIHGFYPNNSNGYGDRNPGIWIHGSKIYVHAWINGGNKNVANYYSVNNKVLPENAWSSIIIIQAMWLIKVLLAYQTF